MKLEGIMLESGDIDCNGQLFTLPTRGTDEEGYPEVLIDAKSIGGKGCWQRQSIKPFIGMKVEFLSNNNKYGFNFTILK